MPNTALPLFTMRNMQQHDTPPLRREIGFGTARRQLMRLLAIASANDAIDDTRASFILLQYERERRLASRD